MKRRIGGGTLSLTLGVSPQGVVTTQVVAVVIQIPCLLDSTKPADFSLPMWWEMVTG